MQISTQPEAVAPEGRSDEPFLLEGARLPFLLVTALFFLWGMSNNLTDILVQQFRKSFTLTQLEAQLVQTQYSSAILYGFACGGLYAA